MRREGFSLVELLMALVLASAVVSAAAATFVVQQTSILNPNNPANAPIPTPRRP